MRKYIFLIFLPFLCACSQPQSTVHSALADSLHAADSVVKPITKARIIIPGKSVGPMRIEGDADSLLTIMGKPDSIDGAMGASLMLWHVKYHKKMYETAIYAHRNMGAPDENINHIKAIWVSSTYYKTADYAGAGSELRDVKKLFKLTMHAIPGYSVKQLALYSDYGAGISFEADSTGRCHAVLVYARGDSSAAYLNIIPRR
jgi:hypothetical protein